MAVLGTVSCGRGPQISGRGGRDGEFPVEVRTMVMEKIPDVRVRTYVGQAAASQSVVIHSPYPGTLEKVHVKTGDPVRKGETVAEISSETVRSAYDMAMATLRQAEDAYVRVHKVHEAGGVPDIRMKEVETSLAKARAEASAAGNALESCKVKAPFDGVVSTIPIYQGSEVTALQPLARIIDVSRIEILFQVPEGELSSIRYGMSASADVPALGIEGIPAEVVAKGVEASPVSHTYECTLKIYGPVAGLAPGMVCKVSVGTDIRPGHMVPADAIHTDRDGRYVWTVRDGRVHKNHILTGGFSSDGIIVSEGLEDGDRVIVEGFRKVSSGMKVREQEI